MQNAKEFEYLHKHIEKLETENMWVDSHNPPDVNPVQVEMYMEGVGYFWGTGRYEGEGNWSIMRRMGSHIIYDPLAEDFWIVVRWRKLPLERNEEYKKLQMGKK